MGRLTYDNKDGSWGIHGYDIRRVPASVYGALCKLKDYEDICESPDKLRQVDELYQEKCREVNHLKDQLRQQVPPEVIPENTLSMTRNIGEKTSRITLRQQALINGVEYALDNALEVTQEDMDEYYRLTGRR